jgi:peptidyl-prolyl cis-trans isomerase A (cyclophilin A)/peptidyl-prolyl cis-trans isomerase B (cyclophilin B)
VAAALLLLVASSAVQAAADPRVRVSTNMGDFVIELLPDRAPLTVNNFLRYVREGHYTHTLIHRAIANFVVQGGGHDATTFDLKPVHEPVVNESGNGLQNKRGMVGLARSEMPHSGNAQFYVNLADNPDLDPLPTRWGYAVFGKVVEGMDVIERIGVTPTGSMGPFKNDSPLKPVIIEKIELLEGASSDAPKPVAVPNSASPAVLSPK